MSLAAKFSAVNLLNSRVAIYLSWSWSVILFSVSLIFVLYSAFWIKLLTLGILFSTAVKGVVVAKLAVLGVSTLTSFIFALRTAAVSLLVISGISHLASLI